MVTKDSEYDFINPDHYKGSVSGFNMDAIDIMEKVFGKEEVMQWCIMTAFKYRLRLGKKPNESIERDLQKEEWYLKKAQELSDK